MTQREDDNRHVIEDFRAHAGVVGGPLTGTPLLLLTVTGAQTSRPRTVPLVYIDDGDRLLVIASNFGARRHPDWYYSLLAHPDVSVEAGEETYAATAVPLQGDQRELAFARVVERFPHVHDVQLEAGRELPVVALIRQA